MRMRKFFRCESRLEQIPSHCSYAGPAVDATVMENESQSTPNEERSRMRNTCGDFVEYVHKIFLTEENGDHEISRCSVSNIRRVAQWYKKWRKRKILIVQSNRHIVHPRRTYYFRIRRYTGSPRTTFVMCRNDPVSDISKPPNDAYAVLRKSTPLAHNKQ